MQVKKKLHINIVVSVMTAFIVLLMLLLALYHVTRTMQESEIADQILNSTFERSTVREDYLRTGSERARVQWFSRHEQINGLLKSASERFKNADDRKTIAEMIRDQEATLKLFSDVVENREKSGSGAVSSALAREIENRLITQLSMRLYDKVLHARALQEAARRHLFSNLKLAGLGIIWVLAIVATASIINSLLLARAITSRIWKLREGAAIIGEGNPDYKIEVKGDDEFADLSTAFNAMTSKLRCSYLDLEKEMAERKRAEEALLESETRYRMLFDSIDEGFCIIEVIFNEKSEPIDYRFLEVNPSFEKQTGLINATGRRMRELAPKHEEHWFEIYGKIALTGEPFRFQNPAEELDRWYDVYAFRFGQPENRQVAVLFNDITERKLSEQERERLIADLTRSNKELEQFAYVSSHDLQEPLRTVTSYVQLLQERYKGRLDEKADIYIQFAVEGAERMQNLIEDLLAYSRITRRGAEFEPTDLNTVCSAAISSLSASIRETHADISKEDLPQVMGDEIQLVQLLQNLIGNAIKYRKPGIAPAIHISAERKGSEWIVSIRDNGIGIEPRFFERIFRIFQRLHTRDEYSGTGIGLALCKRIVERHHGRIWVESIPGRGSTFFFTIPI